MYSKSPTCVSSSATFARAAAASGTSLYTRIGSAMISPIVMRGFNEL